MSASLDKQFGRFLRQQRGQTSFSVFAKQLGVSASTLYRLENAEQERHIGGPSMRTGKRIGSWLPMSLHSRSSGLPNRSPHPPLDSPATGARAWWNVRSPPEWRSEKREHRHHGNDKTNQVRAAIYRTSANSQNRLHRPVRSNRNGAIRPTFKTPKATSGKCWRRHR